MPGKVPPPNITIPTNKPSQPVKNNDYGNWKGKEISSVSPDGKTFRRVSDTDSGIGSPLSGRSISSVSDNDTTPDTPETFLFDKPEIRTALLNDNARLASKPLGKGGHGTVHKVAIKDDSGAEHFLVLKTTNSQESNDREKEAMESIGTHPNIVSYYGEETIEGQKGLLFEYLPGSSLERLYSELLSTPMSAEERMNVIKFLEQQKLEAAAHTGNSDLVHSDQKPSNYICDPKTGVVKLFDFGEAVKSGDKFHAGHEDYAAPETLKTMGSRSSGIKAEVSMDSYAMGQMIYRQIMAKEGELGDPYMFGARLDDIKTAADRGLKIFRAVMAMQPLLKAEQDGTDIQVMTTDLDSIRDRAYQMAKHCLQPPENKEEESIVFQTAIKDDDKGVSLTEAGETASTESSEEEIRDAARQLEPEILLASSLINGLMHINPAKRLSAKAALEHPWFQKNPANREKAMQTLSALNL